MCNSSFKRSFIRVSCFRKITLLVKKQFFFVYDISLKTAKGGTFRATLCGPSQNKIAVNSVFEYTYI